jgi:hypothetical protein
VNRPRSHEGMQDVGYALTLAMNHMTDADGSLPLAVLDFVGIEYGESASAALAGAVSIAQTVEAAGYRRYWVSEHHNMTSLACSAPELLIAHVGAFTSRIRVGAAGIMLPNHSSLNHASRPDRPRPRPGAWHRPADRARAAAWDGRRCGRGVPGSGR